MKMDFTGSNILGFPKIVTNYNTKGDSTLGGISALRHAISKRHRSDLAYQV